MTTYILFSNLFVSIKDVCQILDFLRLQLLSDTSLHKQKLNDRGVDRISWLATEK